MSVDLVDLLWLNRLPDPSDRVALRAVDLGTPHTSSSVRVTFVGDTWPTQFRGQGQTLDMPLVVRFLPGEDADRLALLDLLERAVADVDDRIVLRSYFGRVAGLDPARTVTIPDWQPSPTDGGLAWNVSMTAYRVQD